MVFFLKMAPQNKCAQKATKAKAWLQLKNKQLKNKQL